ncbi:hypothetical protein M433DRAFT_257975, partial [Acidomyces richmondensis BFW]
MASANTGSSSGQQLPPNKASGPACLQRQHQPNSFKHSITVVLRKPQKPDYTKAGAYRPIALLNTLAKVLEAVVARRIPKEAEQRKLLP